MPDDIASEIGAFLDKFWGTERGKVYIAASFERKKGQFKQFFPEWPTNKQSIIRAIVTLNGLGWDTWFAPPIWKVDAPSPDREYIESVNSHWLDFDGNAPDNWELKAKEIGVPEPSVIIETSVKSHQQAFWFFDRVSGEENLDRAETITRNLTAAFATDKSGWDLTQLLRIPGTLNYGWFREGEHKPWYQGEPQQAKILKFGDELAPVGAFDLLESSEKQILSRITINEVPPISEVLALGPWTKEMFHWFSMTEEEATNASQYKRSGSLQVLAYFGAELGFTDEQIYAVLDDADTRWEKYISRSRSGRDKVFRSTIARARDKHGYLTGEALTFAGILGTSSSEDAELDSQPKYIFNFEEFLAMDYKVDWLLDSLIPASGFGLIVGQPGVGKTRLGLQIGMELASGNPQILHRKNSTGPKKVVFLSLEMAGPPLGEFIGNFAKAYDDQVIELKKNFYIAPFGETVPLDMPHGKQLLDMIVNQYKPDVLLIDSLQAAVSKPLTDEQAIKDLTSYIRKLRKDNNVAVIFIHHERKRQPDRMAYDSDLSDIYGSQFIVADVDFALSLVTAGTYTKLDEVKNRLAPAAMRDVALKSEGIRFVLSDIAQSRLLEQSGNDTGDGSKDGNSLSF